ncbi:membrane protein DUF81, putative [Citrifermentans bemidjiense Bem]|uniref:Probable membrane transporter protein n=1 Tax=Citrifermentans bemidjiense (strain ATCC BAA-1014 / DSM 16622 / JCM 12645 / Bem) TaxID=404380 RepID=B5E9A7_CITBB|nr:sulfite exporter TauE/SafE family protein [Citrifermentans bemidjiense]ACH38649.2 membrane protein DUF81, putative [Citrifermentans bemidjiense Bem]
METAYLVLAAITMEFIDSSMGMMYGTVLSPLLIIMNYDVKNVVPSLLISQALGGFIASWRHHHHKNANLNSGTTDHQIATTIIWFGVFASAVGVMLSVRIPVKILNTYIGILVTLIGSMILLGRSIVLTNGKIYLLGFVSAFNKALSGGGFGPLVAGGQLVLSNRCEKGAIASTDFAEAPICLISFLIWIGINGFPPLALCMPLAAGAVVGGFLGPHWLSTIQDREKLKKTLGVLVLFEGIWVLYKVWS